MLLTLKQIYPAFAGALFISLTAGVAVASASAILILLIIFFNNLFKFSLIKPSFIYFFIWSIISLIIFVDGENLFTAAYTIFIPSTIFFVFTFLSNDKKESKQTVIILLIITVSITGVFYYVKSDKGIFLRVRDYLLLSNSYGQAINDFYYSYTLYAVEAIKPSVKSRIDEISTLKVYSDKIKEEFNQNIVSDNSLDDHHKTIRLLCFAGLTIFLPITVYSSFFLVIYGFINCSLEKLNFFNLKTVENRREFVSAIAAGIVNILISLSIFYIIYPLSFNNQSLSIKTMLEHSDYKIRIEGLRELCKENNGHIKKNNGIKDVNFTDQFTENSDTIWSYPDFIKHALNGNIAEKYWLANAFSAAKSPDALIFLEKLIYDPSINVQCAAIDAMTKIGITNKENRDLNFKIKDILKSKIADSDHWYVQQRAYNCLKNIIHFNHDYK